MGQKRSKKRASGKSRHAANSKRQNAPNAKNKRFTLFGKRQTSLLPKRGNMDNQAIRIVHLCADSRKPVVGRGVIERSRRLIQADDQHEFSLAVVTIRSRKQPTQKTSEQAEAHFDHFELVRFGRVDPTLMVRLLRTMRKLRPDIVHTHDARSHFIALLLQPMVGFRIVATATEDRDGPRNTTWIANVDRQLFAGFDRVIAVNNQLARQLCRIGCRPSQVDVIQYGVDTRTFSKHAVEGDYRKLMGIDPECRVIGVSLDPGNAAQHQLVLEAGDLIEAALGRVHLILFDGGSHIVTHPLVSTTRLVADRHKVDVVPWADRTPEVYAAMDVMLVVGGEKGGEAIIEAQSMEVPVVGLFDSIASDLIEPATSGLLAAESTAEAVASHIMHLFSNPFEAASLATAARLRICQRHAVDDAARKVAHTYRRVYSQI